MKTPPLYSDRSFFFQEELSWFLSPAIKDFSSFCLARVPSCFFEAPASSSGKYHPEYTKQKGGLVLHTRAAMGIAKKLLEGCIHDFQRDFFCASPDDFHDALLLALLFHDSCKFGAEERPYDPSMHTVFEHPLIAGEFLRTYADIYKNLRGKPPFPKNDFAIVMLAAQAVVTHMGVFNISKYSNIVLPSVVHASWLGQVVHICDLIASDCHIQYLFNHHIEEGHNG